ncbi:predicted protein [Sclerotinia sclerotiorum 1980 UF-70]|uniref:Uncharacterized protein n=1 Tax=Sclerotinia sclerotiorum (strain ATCC 18683 / 1980 / Ss-1) TaxID=665079 RepID=A7EF83_SCLS1|nr:predicted protein [Sclerotinia sclerotiorum 1980 UF-70]EDO01499.1 predicted protein [Sclerotinia sclerotiorum 1980 UF-70]
MSCKPEEEKQYQTTVLHQRRSLQKANPQHNNLKQKRIQEWAWKRLLSKKKARRCCPKAHGKGSKSVVDRKS